MTMRELIQEFQATGPKEGAALCLEPVYPKIKSSQ